MNLIMKIGWKTADTEVPVFETKIEWEEFYALRPPNKVVALMEIRELIAFISKFIIFPFYMYYKC